MSAIVVAIAMWIRDNELFLKIRERREYACLLHTFEVEKTFCAKLLETPINSDIYLSLRI